MKKILSNDIDRFKKKECIVKRLSSLYINSSIYKGTVNFVNIILDVL